jgi:adenylylsulfate kinase-like enzyme
MIIWLTGIPAAGKTTLGRALADALGAILIDGDSARQERDDKDFSREGRRRNVVHIAVSAAEAASIMSERVVVACISPYASDRQIAAYIAEAMKVRFMLVHVDCPKEIVWARDPKGLYAAAREKRITNVTGFDGDYEDPCDPDVRANTHMMTVDECVKKILAVVGGAHAQTDL